ncbi:casein kinase 2 regulatory subunit [Gonapodya sp. JEL0774]|nr:casein kinase 2 regulatory subunit [Gonapodya sp. JEL0774]
MPTTFATLLVEIHKDGVALITLNRPQALNSFNGQMNYELMIAFDELDNNDDVIVITGSGRAFCAGADLSGGGNAFARRGQENSMKDFRDGGGQLTTRVAKVRKTVIAAINGPAVGVGITMTLPMDIRITHNDAKIGFVFIRRGILPEAASSYFLPQLIGKSRSLALMMTGRVLPASNHLFQGLFTEIVDKAEQVLPAALALAKEIAVECSVVSTAITKALVWHGAETPEGQHLLDSQMLHHTSTGTDRLEGAVSFLEKRPPAFAGRLNVKNDPANGKYGLPSNYPWWQHTDRSLGSLPGRSLGIQPLVALTSSYHVRSSRLIASLDDTKTDSSLPQRIQPVIRKAANRLKRKRTSEEGSLDIGVVDRSRDLDTEKAEKRPRSQSLPEDVSKLATMGHQPGRTGETSEESEEEPTGGGQSMAGLGALMSNETSVVPGGIGSVISSAGMEDAASDDYTKYWIEWFLSLKGNEFFSEIDEEYILDRFNLTGLNTEVTHYQLALDLITDALEEELDDDTRAEVERSARHLYGLIHARYVITSRGLAKMVEKFRRAEFGRCPRVLCHNQPVLPAGLSDVPMENSVKIYCPKCEDLYHPPLRRHAGIDGSYFGTTLPHLLLQVYPNLVPSKPAERYVPRIFGFKVNESAKVHRKQDQVREEQQRRLQSYQVTEE